MVNISISRRIQYLGHVLFFSRFSFLGSRSRWRAFFDGKTVAVVGPGPTSEDHSTEVEGHDIVIRIGYHHWPWPQTGSRTDVWFLEYEYSKKLLEKKYPFEWDQASWILLAWPGKNRSRFWLRSERAFRFARIPLRNWKIWSRARGKSNQVPQVLMELYLLKPKHVSVFGVDFFTTPEKPYQQGSRNLEKEVELFMESRHRVWANHNQLHQKQIASEIQRRRKFFQGNQTFIRLIDMPDEQFVDLYSSWFSK